MLAARHWHGPYARWEGGGVDSAHATTGWNGSAVGQTGAGEELVEARAKEAGRSEPSSSLSSGTRAGGDPATPMSKSRELPGRSLSLLPCICCGESLYDRVTVETAIDGETYEVHRGCERAARVREKATPQQPAAEESAEGSEESGDSTDGDVEISAGGSDESSGAESSEESSASASASASGTPEQAGGNHNSTDSSSDNVEGNADS